VNFNIDEFVAVHGKPENGLAFDFRSYSQLSNAPQFLKDLWDTYGLPSFRDGFFWLLHPIESLDMYRSWMFEDAKNPLPFLRTAFGDFIYWDDNELMVLKRVPVPSDSFLGENFSFIFNDILCRKDTLDDGYFLDLYLEALPRLGPVERDECYGFFLPIAMGGEVRADKLQRVKLREHLAFLSQL
jgi:hypothetical protein